MTASPLCDVSSQNEPSEWLPLGEAASRALAGMTLQAHRSRAALIEAVALLDHLEDVADRSRLADRQLVKLARDRVVQARACLARHKERR